MATEVKESTAVERRTASGAALAEALGYAAAWSGKRVVIKFGGRAMAAGSVGTFIRDVALLRSAGVEPVLVHGGGPEITELLEKLELPARFVDGLRVTDKPTMKAVEMVLGGHVNKRLVGELHAEGAQAVGLSGKDGGILQVRQHPRTELGYVGQVRRVQTDLLETLLEGGYIPVIASLGNGPEGETFNLNADTAAAAIAVALSAEKFLVLTDVAGILDQDQQLISRLEPKGALRLLQDRVVSSGMIPKLEACLTTVERGVPSAHIISVATPHALLLEMFTGAGIGTMVTGGAYAARSFDA